MLQNQKIGQRGFALIEALLVIVIIGLIGGVGYYVMKQRSDAARNTVTSSTQSTASPTPTAAPTGTTAAIDQLTQSDAQSENNINAKYEKQAQSAATSDSAALSNLGGAYNESNL